MRKTPGLSLKGEADSRRKELVHDRRSIGGKQSTTSAEILDLAEILDTPLKEMHSISRIVISIFRI